MANIATFGEIMLRLSPPAKSSSSSRPARGRVRRREANVAVSLAILGHRSRWISVVPSNPVGDAALRELRRYGVDVGAVVRGGRRLGIYFAEPGRTIVLPGPLRPRWLGYRRGRAGRHRLGGRLRRHGRPPRHRHHPALSASAAALTLERSRRPGRRNEGFARPQLPGQALALRPPGPEVMRDIAAHADTLIGNEEDCQKALGIGPAINVAAAGSTSRPMKR